MSQSLSNLYIHIIFHIGNESASIKPEDEEALYGYIGCVLKDSSSMPIMINGTDNHIHVLCVLSKNISLSKQIEEIKRHSSRWIKQRDSYYQTFSWQGGYAGFSVSASKVETVKTYIKCQKEHHKKQSFKDEYVLFLKEYGVEYDEKFLW